MIIDQIKVAKIEAIKAKNEATKGILSLLADRYLLQAIEAKAQSKAIGDVEMISILMKVGKELEDEKATYINNGVPERAVPIDAQITVVKSFLPSMMSEEAIRKEIATLADTSLPSVMKHFKANFVGKVDMSLVNTIAKSL